MLSLAFMNCSQEEPIVTIPTNIEIEAKFQNAHEAMQWFQLSSLPVEWEMEPHAVSEEGWSYWRVIHDTISTMSDLEIHLRGIFTEDAVTYLLSDQMLYRDFYGILHSTPADRGTRMDAGEEVHEIIHISANEIIYRVHLDILEWDDINWQWLEEIYEVEIHDFHLILTDGIWLFANFHLVR